MKVKFNTPRLIKIVAGPLREDQRQNKGFYNGRYCPGVTEADLNVAGRGGGCLRGPSPRKTIKRQLVHCEAYLDYNLGPHK